MNNTVWSKEFPTEPGDYWFYGYRFGKTKEAKPIWVRVQVWEDGYGRPMYVAEGSFMYKSEVENAHFTKIEFPNPPF